MTNSRIMASLTEKVGYGLGDMSSSMFWKVFSYYLPFFYSNIFGLSLVDAGVLVLVTRVWDALSDPMMGIVADRTSTRWGKYRPYLLWVAAPFSICGILLFTTPDWSYGAKLVWAYVTYILMMTVYTGINVPYGAMLGVISENSREKTVFSAYRMFFAYGGSFVALAVWEPLCDMFSDLFGLSLQSSWQMSMAVIAVACFVLFIGCFLFTREHLHTVSNVSIMRDFKALICNRPWWILVGAALCFNLFCTVRGATVAYFFADVIGLDANLCIFTLSFVFYSGLFLSIGEVANMAGVALTVPVSGALGKKSTFICVNVLLVILSVAFFYVPLTAGGYWWMLILQIAISLLTGMMSPLIWSMYADVSDYSELRYRTASTGLIFSSSSMAQKFGGAIGGAAVLWLLEMGGYSVNTGVADQQIVQPAGAIAWLWYLMTFIPAAISVLAVVIVWFYPLTTKRVDEMAVELKSLRADSDKDIPQQDEMTDYANTNS